MNYVDEVQTKHTRMHKEGTRKQVQVISAQAGAEYAQTGRTWSASTRARHRTCHLRCTLAELANREMRLTTMMDHGPKEPTVSIRSKLVAEDLGVFLNLPCAQPVAAPLAAERRLVPFSINYACRKWSRMVRTDAPSRAAGCPSTIPSPIFPSSRLNTRPHAVHMKIGVREIVLIQILPWRVDAAASQSPLPAGCKTLSVASSREPPQ
eukprot:CAMPEP_0179483440 /NCGR_PEP_ID=MMETSP0799-20121207/60638_1 /TAXON_ID=46947 /ORGANISM="Geminigera cryophila, Strain CCMP2564" /LENGTH=207 /DNA_ID=CAMNT_0021296989 /DNA_START=483 /DNA_END=1103 /DNA_ORIENTATION=+